MIQLLGKQDELAFEVKSMSNKYNWFFEKPKEWPGSQFSF